MLSSGQFSLIRRKLEATMKPSMRKAIVFLFITHLAALSSARAAESWQPELEKTVQAAKREGEVAIYGPHNPIDMQA